jgi:hypothetical protein
MVSAEWFEDSAIAIAKVAHLSPPFRPWVLEMPMDWSLARDCAARDVHTEDVELLVALAGLAVKVAVGNQSASGAWRKEK